MLTVTQDFQADYRVKGSKFLSYISPCDTTEEAEIKLSGVRDIHPTATHHCYAFRVNPSEILEYSQDDGEPSGTAGLPILNAIRSANIVNTIIVVVRYYGGTKLGKGGLIDAYGTTASMVIESSDLKKFVATRRFEIEYPYDQQSLIEKLKHSFTLFEIDSAYTDKVKLVLECPISEAKKLEGKLNNISHLLTNVEKKGTYSRVLS